VIWLARHGETADNADGRVQGWIDTPLSDVGREQARALAEQAAGMQFEALYTSQLVRARETAEIVGRRIGLVPIVDERFSESRRGCWEGRLLTDIERDDPEGWAAWRRGDKHRPLGGSGESLAQHVARVDEALDDVSLAELPALVICHGGTIRSALVARAGREYGEFMRIAVPNAELMRLEAA
jgi:probable phosphoglycerate mutase